MRNIPAYERSPILDVGRSSTASTKMHMNVIHGHIDGPSSDFATLIVFDFTTITLKPDRRVRRAEIRVNFTEHDQKPSTGLEIYSFAPHTHLVSSGAYFY